jgi:DNA-binding beta-propeller fold protein YncE
VLRAAIALFATALLASSHGEPVLIKRIGTHGRQAALSGSAHRRTMNGSVRKLDPATNRIVSTVKAGTAPVDGARGPDGLEWIPNQDGTVTLIEPATNTVAGTLRPGGLTFVVRNAFGSMWVDDFNGTTLSRYQPN